MCICRFVVDNHTLFSHNIMCDCRIEVRSMNAKEKIEALLESSPDGTITAAQHRDAIKNCEKLERFLRENTADVIAWCCDRQRDLKREMLL